MRPAPNLVPTVVSLLAAGVCLAAVFAPATQEDLETRLGTRAGALAKRALEEQGASGLSVVLSLSGEVLLERGYGYAGWERDEKADAATTYRAGPLLDHVLAVAMLRLVDDDQVELDAELGELLPTLAESPLADVELRHLLAQTSGVTDYDALLAGRELESFPREEVVAWLAGEPLENEPGTCFEHSSSNALLVGLVLEELTGRDVQSWVTAQLFEPLRLEDTSWCWTGSGPREASTTGHELGDELELEPAVPLPFGADGLCTSARDLERWMRAIVEAELVSARGFQLLTAPRRLADGSSTGHGYGFGLAPVDDELGFATGSVYADASVHLAHYPDRDLTIAVLVSGGDSSPRAIEQSLARVALGLPEPGVEDLALSPEEQKRYTGVYHVGCTRIDVLPEEHRLRMEYPDGYETTLLAQGDHRFVSASDPGVTVTFHMEDGRAESFLLDEHGVQSVARRFE